MSAVLNQDHPREGDIHSTMEGKMVTGEGGSRAQGRGRGCEWNSLTRSWTENM